jgi:hypothetical protein
MNPAKLPLRSRLAASMGRLPTPERALRLARLLIPLSLLTGLLAEPLLRWLLRALGAGA